MRTFHYDHIDEQVRSVDDLQYLASHIDLLLVSLFQSAPEAFSETLTAKLPPDLAHLFEETLSDQGVPLTERETLQHFFHGLKDHLAHLPVLQLTVAYHPTGEQIEALSDWTRKATGNPVVLQLHYDPSVLGGAIIAYGGQYADLSVKKRLNTVYEAKKP
jgi:hypothetical protein